VFRAVPVRHAGHDPSSSLEANPIRRLGLIEYNSVLKITNLLLGVVLRD
jgi:hypothetical protein